MGEDNTDFHTSVKEVNGHYLHLRTIPFCISVVLCICALRFKKRKIKVNVKE